MKTIKQFLVFRLYSDKIISMDHFSMAGAEVQVHTYLSQYGIEAFKKYGPLKGFWLTLKELVNAIHGVGMGMIRFRKVKKTSLRGTKQSCFYIPDCFVPRNDETLGVLKMEVILII